MRLSRARLALALALASILATVPTSRVLAAGESQGSIHFTIGSKALKSDSLDTGTFLADQRGHWVPNTHHIGLGMEASWGLKGWPVLLALDALATSDDAAQGGFKPFTFGPGATLETETSTWELGIGLRTPAVKRWGLRPYVGAGGTFVRANVNANVVNRTDPTAPFVLASFGDNGSAYGFWMGGGLLWGLGKRMDLGLSVRYSSAEVDLKQLGDKLKAGGTHIGMVVGWSWPR